jgi:Kef-type K+ transport system membrane component KefB
MTSDLIFLAGSFVFITVPVALWRLLRLNGIVPLVVMQILLGIALSPSLLGQIAPEPYKLLLNASTLGPFPGIASIGVLFFGFITGLHIDPVAFRNRGRAFAAVAAASIIIPTCLGVLPGLFIGVRHPDALGTRGDLFVFAGGIGVCLGVTALPVLGAVLRELNLLGRNIASLALGIAAVNDAVIWLLLGALMTAAQTGEASQAGIVASVVVLPIYLLVMLRVRPLLRRVLVPLMRDGVLGESGLAVIGASAIGSAVVIIVRAGMMRPPTASRPPPGTAPLPRSTSSTDGQSRSASSDRARSPIATSGGGFRPAMAAQSR